MTLHAITICTHCSLKSEELSEAHLIRRNHKPDKKNQYHESYTWRDKKTRHNRLYAKVTAKTSSCKSKWRTRQKLCRVDLSIGTRFWVRWALDNMFKKWEYGKAGYIEALIDTVNLHVAAKPEIRYVGSKAQNGNRKDDEHQDDGVSQLTHMYLACTQDNETESRSRPYLFAVRIIEPKNNWAKFQKFVKQKKLQVDGLTKREICEVCEQDDVTADSISITRKFLFTLKHYSVSDEKDKVRFLAKGYDDCEKTFLVYDTCTLRSSSLRTVPFSAAFYSFLIFLRDVTHAYLKSKQRLTCNVDIRERQSIKTMFLSKEDKLLHLNKPLYGLCDVG